MFLTTHYMDEAAHLCDRLVIMHRGKILTEGNRPGLIAEHAGEQACSNCGSSPEERAGMLGELGNIEGIAIEEVEDIVYVFGGGDVSKRIAEQVGTRAGYSCAPATWRMSSFALTGRGLLD